MIGQIMLILTKIYMSNVNTKVKRMIYLNNYFTEMKIFNSFELIYSPNLVPTKTTGTPGQ